MRPLIPLLIASLLIAVPTAAAGGEIEGDLEIEAQVTLQTTDPDAGGDASLCWHINYESNPPEIERTTTC